MRDFVLAPIFILGTLWALAHPAIGVLMWTWISIMNPHRFSWALYAYPVAAFIGGATLIGLLITRDRRDFFLTAPSVMLLLLQRQSKQSLASALQKILAAPLLARQMGAVGRGSVEREHNWDANVAKITDAVPQLIPEHADA